MAKDKKYGLLWEHDESNDVVGNSIFEEVEHLNILEKLGGVDNYLIEGDNLHSLHLLNENYKEKVHVIYIDPPYNTGNNSLYLYNDNFNNNKFEYSHSEWLSFMHTRLLKAHDLLRKDGLIFISISDKQLYHLKLLLDEVFGEDNFIANLIWKSYHGIKNDSRNVSKNTEYILVYAKDITSKRDLIRNEDYDKTHRYKYNDNDGKGYYNYSTMYVKSGSQNYDLEFPDGRVWRAPEGTFPRYREETAKEYVKTGKIIWKKNGKHPLVKRYLNEVKQGRKLSTLLDSNEVGYTMTGDKDLKNILGKVFQNPKPVNLIKKLLSVTTDKDSIILDFFAGSGTTGQAVMELNKEDGGNRSFILCTNNEVNEGVIRKYFMDKGFLNKNTISEYNKFYIENKDYVHDFLESSEFEELGIARRVTHKRLEKLIKGYVDLDGKTVEGYPMNLKYLRVNSIDNNVT